MRTARHQDMNYIELTQILFLAKYLVIKYFMRNFATKTTQVEMKRCTSFVIMASTSFTEDQVRDIARTKLHLEESESAKAGVGQLTSFNQLGFRGVKDRPDGWYLPNETHYPALVLEVKGSNVKLGDKEREELLKNIRIVESRYNHVIGLLSNGYELEVYKDGELVAGEN